MTDAQRIQNLANICDRNQNAIHELTARVAELEKQITDVRGTTSNPSEGEKN
jgi:polyhydroxyalkanoate synthesis regulator phasin